MPVYIEEIVFRGEITGAEPPAAGTERTPAQQREDREALIDAAAAEVMRILRRERER